MCKGYLAHRIDEALGDDLTVAYLVHAHLVLLHALSILAGHVNPHTEADILLVDQWIGNFHAVYGHTLVVGVTLSDKSVDAGDVAVRYAGHFVGGGVSSEELPVSLGALLLAAKFDEAIGDLVDGHSRVVCV